MVLESGQPRFVRRQYLIGFWEGDCCQVAAAASGVFVPGLAAPCALKHVFYCSSRGPAH